MRIGAEAEKIQVKKVAYRAILFSKIMSRNHANTPREEPRIYLAAYGADNHNGL